MSVTKLSCLCRFGVGKGESITIYYRACQSVAHGAIFSSPQSWGVSEVCQWDRGFRQKWWQQHCDGGRVEQWLWLWQQHCGMCWSSLLLELCSIKAAPPLQNIANPWHRKYFLIAFMPVFCVGYTLKERIKEQFSQAYNYRILHSLWLPSYPQLLKQAGDWEKRRFFCLHGWVSYM